MHIVIFAGGTLRPGTAVDAALSQADMLIAADSGAATALRYNRIPDLLVGDFDSLDEQVKQQLDAQGCEILTAPVEKDETDSELAIQQAIERGATSITLLGGLGGPRFDHTLANTLLLAAYPTIPLRIVDGPTICWLLRGPGRTTIQGRAGDLLSLLPLAGEAEGIRTTNLYYPLYGETVPFGKPRGVSNTLTQSEAEVSLEHGSLLVIHTNSQELKE